MPPRAQPQIIAALRAPPRETSNGLVWRRIRSVHNPYTSIETRVSKVVRVAVRIVEAPHTICSESFDSTVRRSRLRLHELVSVAAKRFPPCQPFRSGSCLGVRAGEEEFDVPESRIQRRALRYTC